jgi:hypothetical protein
MTSLWIFANNPEKPVGAGIRYFEWHGCHGEKKDASMLRGLSPKSRPLSISLAEDVCASDQKFFFWI